MKTLFKKLAATFVLLFAGFFAMVNGQTPTAQTIIIDDSQLYAAYQVDDKNVIIVLEMIDDFTDNTNDYFPNADFVSFLVDVNQNAEIDKYIDTSYGLVGKQYVRSGVLPGLCTQYLASNIGKTGCGVFKSAASLDYGFRASDKEARQHPVYKFTIPKRELSKIGDSAHIRLSFYSAGEGFKVYPAKEREEVYNSLSKVLIINF